MITLSVTVGALVTQECSRDQRLMNSLTTSLSRAYPLSCRRELSSEVWVRHALPSDDHLLARERPVGELLGVAGGEQPPHPVHLKRE